MSKLYHHWKPTELYQRIEAPASLRDWLLDYGSLTRKIRSVCPNMQVRVLSEKWQRPLLDEAKILKLSSNQSAWIRCVLLECNDKPLVYARTVIPNCHIGNPWFRLKQLGNQPLGEVLFQLPAIERGEFEITCVAQHDWPGLVSKYPTSFSFARRSVFYQNRKPLLLTEAFLTT